MIVTLNDEQREYAAEIARERRSASQDLGLPNSDGFRPDKGSEYDLMGACGELAAAICFGQKPILGVNTFKADPDLLVDGFPVEVRTTAGMIPRLYFRAGDPPDRAYVLVRELSHGVRYQVLGWTVPDLDKDMYRLGGAPGRTPTPCVAEKHLRPVETLPPWIMTRNANVCE